MKEITSNVTTETNSISNSPNKFIIKKNKDLAQNKKQVVRLMKDFRNEFQNSTDIWPKNQAEKDD